MKLATILGARPQFIKAAMVSMEVSLHTDITEIIVHTGQHFDPEMSRVFFEEMGIPEPDYHLGINTLSHGAMTGRMLERIEEVLKDEKPDWVLVYGDTNSTLAGALAARKMGLRVAHIEAGLRSFNMAMPEEINRILTDRISDLLFAPTANAVENLKAEGFDSFGSRIVMSGDIMFDASVLFGRRAEEKSNILEKLELTDSEFILCTVHRQENTDDPDRLGSILDALNHIHREMPVILPMHPRTRKIVEQRQFALDFQLIDPVGYMDMLQLLAGCSLVMTDSGGLQKEAYFNGKHCLVLRDETEWVELVEAGVNRAVGWRKEAILEAFAGRDSLRKDFSELFYGKGETRKTIVEELRG